MKRLVLAGLATVLLATPGFAVPTGEQKAEFYRVCMGIAQDDTLCSCKADAAMDLIEEDFMALVIDAMQGKRNPSGEQYSAYNTYVAKSNQICKPNY